MSRFPRTTDEQPYTVAEVAEKLRVGQSTVYDHVKAGTFPHISIGRRILIPAPAVKRLLGLADGGSSAA